MKKWFWLLGSVAGVIIVCICCLIQQTSQQQTLPEDLTSKVNLRAADVTQMYVGFRNPSGWEYTTKDREQIEQALNYLNQIKIVRMDKAETSSVVSGIPQEPRVLYFYKSDGQYVELRFGEKLMLNGDYYSYTTGGTTDPKEWMETLKSRELSLKGKLENNI